MSMFLRKGEIWDLEEIDRRLQVCDVDGKLYPEHLPGECVRVLDENLKPTTHYTSPSHGDHLNVIVFTATIKSGSYWEHETHGIKWAGYERHDGSWPLSCIKTNARQALERLRAQLDRGVL